MLFPINLAFVSLSIIGWVLIVFNQFKLGAVLMCIGCIIFFPLGAIGIIGVMKLKNQRKVKQFMQNEYGSN